MGKKMIWNWYMRFFKVWTTLMGVMVISGLLRGRGLCPSNFSLMIFDVMWIIIQILCIVCSPLLLFKFAKGLAKKEEKINELSTL